MRIWNSGGMDEGSRHVIGNGEMLVYGVGPNIEYLYGPPYSSPPFLGLVIETDDDEIRSDSEREDGTAIWSHRIYGPKGVLAAHMTDYMLPARNVFIREIDACSELRFRIDPAPGIRRANGIRNDFGQAHPDVMSILLSYTNGPTFLTHDPVTKEVDLLITTQGRAVVEHESDGSLRVRVRSGRSRLLFAAGPRFPDLLRDTAAVLAERDGRQLAETRAYWRRFSAGRRDFAALIPHDHPHRAAMLRAIDSVSVLVKCQQSSSGGMTPGHRYSPMAYVRDMAGVLRGLLALGYLGEAKAILQFWKRKWERFGNLQNAEGMGDDSVRLSGGNNEVEIPAYVILCVFEYYEQTNDESVLEELWPMMDWAFAVQLPHLEGGMTEFSSDETYIAGGVFPRHLMFQGSAESTLMFVTGGAKLADWAERSRRWSGTKLRRYREELDKAAGLFKRNFMPDGVLYANQPRREQTAGKPRFQFGFCDAHGKLDGRLVNRWLELQEQGYYLCAECKVRSMPDPEVDPGKLYELNSVNLLPLYLGSDLFTLKEAAAIMQPGLEWFRRSGKIPSDLGGSRSLGYDCGLMLYNAVILDAQIKEQLLEKALSLLDPTGAWAEYYDDDRPADCCRARPWESAMNIEGIAAYIRAIKRDGEVVSK